MKIYRSKQRFLASPLKQYIAEGALIFRYEEVTKIVIRNNPSTDYDPFTTEVDDVEFDNPAHVTWVYGIEPPPNGTNNNFFTLVASIPEEQIGADIYMRYKGTIANSAGFQAASLRSNGDYWRVTSNVTDPVTGISYTAPANIYYDSTAGRYYTVPGSGGGGTQGPQGEAGPQGPSGGGGGTQGPQGETGPAGSQGTQGPAGGGGGAQGPQGEIGPQGESGVQGASGSDGSQGAQGATGQGTQGPAGQDGSQGADGNQGPQGDSGIAGPQGPGGGATGPQGDTGAQGPEGDQGVQGAEGDQGPQGAEGDQGTVGPQGPGPAGPQGTQGPEGPQGSSGSDGAQGDTGPQGEAGAQGFTGDTGSQGPQGPQGEAGQDGAQGSIGQDGPQGDTGAQGQDGPQGDTGSQGPQGPSGSDGTQGDTGPQGLLGAQGVTGANGQALRYSAGNGARVTADATGITFSKAAGVGTLSVPSGVEVFSLLIEGATADLSSNNFTVRVSFSGSEYNNDDSDGLFPKCMVWYRTTEDFGGPTSGLPYNLRDAGDVGISIQVTALGSGSMDILFLSLNGFTKWSLMLDF